MGTVEHIEKNKVKFTFTVSPERFREGLTYSYNKNKSRIHLDGFRKGKAPRKIIERLYGKDFFYNDAVNHVLPDAYEAACDENALEPVYRPSISLEDADEDTGAVFTAEVYVKPEVEIDGYYGLTYPKTETEPTDSDIQEKLQAEREKNARQISVERPSATGDVVTINFTGYVDDEPFEGGEGKDFDLELGTNTFIDTFEEQLTNHVPGDDVTVNVTFPEQYQEQTLAGKPAVFKVEILDVKTKEYPEIDDEFAQDVSEFDTLAEYRDDLAGKIREAKTKQAEATKLNHVMDNLIEKAVMEVPDVMYEARLEEMMDEFEMRLRMQGMTLPMYLQYTGMTEDKLKSSWEGNAKNDVHGKLVLEAVAKKEEMTVSDEDFQAHLEELASRGNQSAEELNKKITPARRKEIEEILLAKKAQEFVLEHAIAVEND
jgi:trigger factor